MSKRLEIAVGIATIVGVIIAAIALIPAFGEWLLLLREPSTNLAESTLESQTDNPVTIAPSATVDTDPTMYDDFNNPVFDSSFNTDLWHYWGQPEACEVFQQNGVVVFKNTPPEIDVDCLLTIGKPSKVTADYLAMFEARIKLSEHQGGRIANQGLLIVTRDLPGEMWFTFCGIASGDQGADFVFDVTNYGDGDRKDIYHTAPGSYGRWYTFRIEVEADTMLFSCFVDDNLFYSIIPSDAVDLTNARFERHLDAWRSPGSLATSYVDDVRVLP